MRKTAELDQYMPIFQGHCPVCFVKRRDLDPHSVKECPNRHLVNGWLDFKRTFVFTNFTYCWKCGIPQDKESNGEGPVAHSNPDFFRNCPFQDFVAIVLFAILKVPLHRDRMVRQFSLPEDTAYADICRWLSTEDSDAGEYYKGLEVFLWFFAEYLAGLS